MNASHWDSNQLHFSQSYRNNPLEITATSPTVNSSRDVPAAVLLALVGLLIYLPLTVWLIGAAMAHEQLLMALVVFIGSGVLIYRKHADQLRWHCSLSTPVLVLIGTSYAAAIVFSLWKVPQILLGGYGSGLAAVAIYLWGERVRRPALVMIAAFVLFGSFALLVPVLDWPLRTMAGQHAAWIFGTLGANVDLGLTRAGGEPILLLAVDGQFFNVAAECNGFGTISACLLMSTILVLYRRLPWLDKGIFVLVGLFIGFYGNIVRIVVIVFLAPHVDNYMLMHETIGLLAFYASLGLVWWSCPKA